MINTPYIVQGKLENKTAILLILFGFYILFSLVADCFCYLYVYVGLGLFISGATCFFPATFPIIDLVCEVFGFRISFIYFFLFGLVIEAIFAFFCYCVVSFFPVHDNTMLLSYIKVFGSVWIFVAGSAISNLIVGYLNLYLMSKWKIKMKGEHFWLRSVIISVAMEALMIFILFGIAFTNKDLPVHWSTIVLTTILYDLIVATIFSGFASIAKPWIIKKTGDDVYDHNESYNPFKI